MPSHAWIIRFGSSLRVYFVPWHAEQMMRALDLNGTAYTLEIKGC